jgi:PAS domain S-box-containing protein
MLGDMQKKAARHTQPPTFRDVILDSIADGVFTVDLDWKITEFNRAAEQITGIKKESALGRYCFEVFKASICEKGCCLRETLGTGRPNVHKAAYVVRYDGKPIPISISTAVLKGANGETIGGVETFRDLSIVDALRKELKQRFTFHDIVTKNDRMHEILTILPQLALSDSTVLLEGESGTGKELFARAIHNSSNRKDSPLIVVNCGAVPDTLLESELFGHVAGAFTDAQKKRVGRFALADKGTIFLDEIGDISASLQVSLLRVLQEKTIEPLGSSEIKKVDIRIIAATNRKLSDLVNRGTFRQDLYYRLNVFALSIPPLRDRRDDIPLLVDHFIDRFNRLKNKEVSHIDSKALSILMRHSFSGNVRELLNAIEHAFVLCPGGVLLAEHLPSYLLPKDGALSVKPDQTVKEFEAGMIREVLSRHNYNRTRAAKELGMHKTTLWRKMKKLGIQAKTRHG